MKTVEQVVEQLQQEGTLDENKLRAAFKQGNKFKKLCLSIWAILFFIIIVKYNGVGAWIFFLIYSLLGFKFYKELYKKSVHDNIILYTFGLKTVGQITDKTLYKHMHAETVGRVFPKGLLIEYSFIDDNNDKLIGETFVINSEIKANKLDDINVGNVIDILFLKETPSINVMYIDNWNKTYNVRKKCNNIGNFYNS